MPLDLGPGANPFNSTELCPRLSLGGGSLSQSHRQWSKEASLNLLIISNDVGRPQSGERLR